MSDNGPDPLKDPTFLTTIDAQVLKRLQERYETNRRWAAALFTGVATVLLAFVAIATYLFQLHTENAAFKARDAAINAISIEKTSVVQSIQEAFNVSKDDITPIVKAIVEEEVGTFQEEVDAYQFESQILFLQLHLSRIDEATGISAKDAELIMQRIETLDAELGEDNESRVRLLPAIETAVKNFARAHLVDFTDQLEEMYHELLETSDDIDITLASLLQNF